MSYNFERMMLAETEIMRRLLPVRYICEPRTWGVHCFDPTHKGINDDHMAHEKYNPETDNHWMLIVKSIKQKFGERLQEINCIEPQYNTKFTVYLRKLPD